MSSLDSTICNDCGETLTPQNSTEDHDIVAGRLYRKHDHSDCVSSLKRKLDEIKMLYQDSKAACAGFMSDIDELKIKLENDNGSLPKTWKGQKIYSEEELKKIDFPFPPEPEEETKDEA